MSRTRSREVRFDPPYDRMLAGVLSFGTLAETEKTLLRLEELRHRFLAAGDKKGVGYCRRVGALGRARAAMIASNRRVSPARRMQKEEAALWFRIWLETPEIFSDWLALRKATDEYRQLAAAE
jgi:hypothetical protein